MGLFDNLIAGAVRGAFQQLDTSALPSILGQILGRTDLGSLGGLLDTLRRNGLDQQVGSWLGQGRNEPVSEDQLRGAIGDRELGRMAEGAGVSTDDLLSILVRHLPQVIDGLSPNGRLQEDPLAVNPDRPGGTDLPDSEADDGSGAGGSLADQAGLDDLGRRR